MSKKLRTVSPTGSFALKVPRRVEEIVDLDLYSLYLPGDDTLLQISSFAREQGAQVSASARLQQRIVSSDMHEPELVTVSVPSASDVAAALMRDEEGVRWLFVYVVWPRLTVLATVSHPKVSPLHDSWALDAIGSLEIQQHSIGENS